MKIRHARPEDAKQISEIAHSLRLNSNAGHNNGFLIYVLDEEGYKKRIKSSSYFYVAEKKENIEGFLMCYDNIALTKLVKEKEFKHQDGTIEFILNQEGPYIFGDQIGVRKNVSRKGVGKALMFHLIKGMKKQGLRIMYVSILYKPVKNKSSIVFCEKGFRFKKIGEVENKDNLIWTIYKMKLD